MTDKHARFALNLEAPFTLEDRQNSARDLDKIWSEIGAGEVVAAAAFCTDRRAEAKAASTVLEAFDVQEEPPAPPSPFSLHKRSTETAKFVDQQRIRLRTRLALMAGALLALNLVVGYVVTSWPDWFPKDGFRPPQGFAESKREYQDLQGDGGKEAMIWGDLRANAGSLSHALYVYGGGKELASTLHDMDYPRVTTVPDPAGSGRLIRLLSSEGAGRSLLLRLQGNSLTDVLPIPARTVASVVDPVSRKQFIALYPSSDLDNRIVFYQSFEEQLTDSGFLTDGVSADISTFESYLMAKGLIVDGKQPTKLATVSLLKVLNDAKRDRTLQEKRDREKREAAQRSERRKKESEARAALKHEQWHDQIRLQGHKIEVPQGWTLTIERPNSDRTVFKAAKEGCMVTLEFVTGNGGDLRDYPGGQ